MAGERRAAAIEPSLVLPVLGYVGDSTMVYISHRCPPIWARPIIWADMGGNMGGYQSRSVRVSHALAAVLDH